MSLSETSIDPLQTSQNSGSHRLAQWHRDCNQSIHYKNSSSNLIICIKHTCPQKHFLPFQPLHHHGQGRRAVKACHKTVDPHKTGMDKTISKKLGDTVAAFGAMIHKWNISYNSW